VDTITRRKFLVASGVTGAVALAAGATTIGLQQLLHAAEEDPLPAGAGVLVLITLYGGNDALNTLVPYADPAYHDARPELAYPAETVLHLDDQLGLNPSMKGFKQLWDDRKLAVVRGVSYPHPNRSHFASMDIWQSGAPDHPTASGWIGRWLDHNGRDPVTAVSVGATLPPLMAGDTTAGAALPLDGFSLPGGTVGRGLTGLADPQSGEPALQAACATSYANLLRVDRELGPALSGSTDPGEDEDRPAAGASAGGGGALAAQLDLVARCIEAGAPTRVYAVSTGGFDTHAEEKDTQSRLVGEVDTAVSAFLGRMAKSPRGAGVVAAAYSEFGRRVHANASQGTDHGTAGVVFVAGQRVRGGYHGEQPSLTDLDGNGDLKASTDLRDLYAGLLTGVLGTDPGQVLTGPYSALPIV
jgi:uncharacterized protein (DUF1501 family)